MTVALFQILNCQVNVYIIAKSDLIRYAIITARCYASAVLAMGLCPSVCVCLSVCLSVCVCHKPVFY